jgi:cytochrome c-type biogenesis protein CcmH/NrfG
MANESIASQSAGSAWSSRQVYSMATICLLLGLALGYLFRGSQTRPTASAASSPAGSPPPIGMSTQMPTLDQMKHMADKQAEPLLSQLKDNPNNSDLLKKVAKIYESTHQFQDAANYYGKALDLNPNDATTRTEMASCLYYNGDVDGALAQLQQALKVDPTNSDSLFNLGMIRWKGKNDTAGALQAWNQLLKSNPKLDPDKKTLVEKVMAEAKKGPTV